MPTAQGCLRPLLISFAVTVALLVGLVLWHGETAALMWDNASAMGEGVAEAEALRTPNDVLDYVRTYPERASLVVLDMSGTQRKLTSHAGDTMRPVPGLPRLLVLAAYARDVARGRLDSTASISLDTLSRYHLPPGDDESWRQLAQAAGADSAVTISDVVCLAVQHNHPTATDWLVDQLEPFDAPGLDAPRSRLGLVLNWVETAGQQGPIDERTIEAAARRYRGNAAVRDSMRQRLRATGAGLSLEAQRRLAGETLPRGTARGYVDLLHLVLADSLVSEEASQLFRDVVEQPAPETSGISLLATEGGSMPGHIAVAAYARRGDGTGRIVALLLEDLPMGVYYRLTRTGLDKGLVLQLLTGDRSNPGVG